MKKRISWPMALVALLANTAHGFNATDTAQPPDMTGLPAHWTVAAPLQARLPPSLATVIRPTDVLSYLAPGIAYPMRNIGLQCQGGNATLMDVPSSLVSVKTVRGDMETRFGTAVIDNKKAFRLQIGANDILPPNHASRCELLAYPMPNSAFPKGQTFWMAFSFWADDWSGTEDEQLIAQMHIQEPRHILLNPFFALIVRGNTLRVELRHNDLEIPSQVSTQLVTAAKLTMPTRQWITAVVQARISTKINERPFLRLWFNGQQIADYSGPLGYVLPADGYAYPKVGIYHWHAGNDWDLKIPIRIVFIGNLLTVQDPSDQYSQHLLQTVVEKAGKR